MLTIDDLNTVSLDVLNRFGNRDAATDLSLFRLSINVIASLCRQHKSNLDDELFAAADKVTNARGTTQEKIRAIREVNVKPKSLDDICHSSDPWTQCEDLMHFALYGESAAHLGDDASDFDFLFTRELVGLSVSAKCAYSDEAINVADMADALFLADVFVSWAGFVALNGAGLDTATNVVGKCYMAVQGGVCQLPNRELCEFLPPEIAT